MVAEEALVEYLCILSGWTLHVCSCFIVTSENDFDVSAILGVRAVYDVSQSIDAFNVVCRRAVERSGTGWRSRCVAADLLLCSF